MSPYFSVSALTQIDNYYYIEFLRVTIDNDIKPGNK